ncbi:MAG TPA: NADH-quinone oxidoreductase subunit NuoG [Flavobacterium sp.]
MNKALIYVDNIPLYVALQTTVIQACEKVGLKIPRFCFHDLLGIAGNCRMCLIEIERSPKPQVACGLPVLNKITIFTGSPTVKKAREGVLEFLLLNHPLDCPICDQGGECDLQNQAMKYGTTYGRFYTSKRGVGDKGFGPAIKTVITRCIHCTRCIRFAEDVAGVGDLGTSLRGVKTQVGTYVTKAFISEVSGNIIDLCPVGALTTKPHAFKTRPWEIKTTKSIDLTDCLGAHIVIESKKSKPIRVVPRPCMELNEEWITDKARFIYEGFSHQRLTSSYYYKNNTFNSFSSILKITTALNKFLQAQSSIQLILGRNLDCNTLEVGKFFCKKIGWDFTTENLNLIYPAFSCFFQSTGNLPLLNKTDFCLILGINPRIEASLASLRINKQNKSGKLQIYNVGSPSNLTYKVKNLGLHLNHLLSITYGNHAASAYVNSIPVFIYGDSLTKRKDGQSSLTLAFISQRICSKIDFQNSFYFPLGANSVGNSFLGLAYPNLFRSNKKTKRHVDYFLGLQDQILLEKTKNQIVFENSHYNDVIGKHKFLVSSQSNYEKTGDYINCEGRLQEAKSFLRFVQEPITFTKTFVDIELPNLKKQTNKTVFHSFSSSHFQKLATSSKKLKIFNTPLQTLVGDIYRTDPITSASLTLSKLSGVLRQSHWSFEQ